ncbi:hypothetical protein POM88_003902 [Heracleum sosnowskyi]|uniref:Vacuolar protein sorting-associated protein 13 VPS13 adaptor binding domain-containing protein n=1 Tax=Heracleum sosnowskyi TaxID=360622 RepID=A0AAD8NCS7_9APIA|nr:hypothetical protein POM88_003902 [Heracleum sosnowskyi]
MGEKWVVHRRITAQAFNMERVKVNDLSTLVYICGHSCNFRIIRVLEYRFFKLFCLVDCFVVLVIIVVRLCGNHRLWFIKCNKVRLILLDKNESHTILDLDALSGLTEIDLEVEECSGCNFITKLGVSLKPSTGNVIVPSRTVFINPRYMVSNESKETIVDEMQGVVSVTGKQRTTVHLRNVIGNKKEIGVFDKILRHHKSARDDSLLYVQFKPKDIGFDWSGPVCVTSLGRFFLKFKRFKDYQIQGISNHAATSDHEYSSVHVIEEDSTLVLHFYRSPHTGLPYRIENFLEDAHITYYQKGSSEPEVIGAGGNVDYARHVDCAVVNQGSDILQESGIWRDAFGLSSIYKITYISSTSRFVFLIFPWDTRFSHGIASSDYACNLYME